MSRVSARDPAADLRRIAYLLERANEASYRVRAFRSAADAIAGLAPAEVRRRAETGTLRSIKGVGEKTARCITESVAGEVPEYLRQLDPAGAGDENGGSGAGPADPTPPPAADATSPHADATSPHADAALALRRALRGDCHSHSDWSDGGGSIEEMALAAAELGHQYLVLTDHSPRLRVARGLSPERLREQLDRVEQINAELPAGFRILTGIEVDILTDGTLDQDADLLARLDLVVASIHSHLRDPAEAMTERMLAAVASPHVDVLGHCTGRKIATGDDDSRGGGRGSDRAHRNSRGRPESAFDAEAVFAACAKRGTAVEINCRPDRLDPPRRLIRLAVEAGCLFAIDTDAHAPGQLEWQPHGCERAVSSGVTPDRVVNTWSQDELLAWSEAR